LDEEDGDGGHGEDHQQVAQEVDRVHRLVSRVRS
jgi:hypothetical protein